MIKANPYVYPFSPFGDLSDKNIIDGFIGEKEVDIVEVKKTLLNQKISINFKQRKTAERIMEIFLHNRVCFGSREQIKKNYNYWLKKINFFIKKKKRIEFSILGFPFKVPVPLKTNRLLPDMGEVLSLHRLNNLMDLIGRQYASGARATVFTEGVFGDFVGVSKEEADNYRDYLIKLRSELNLKYIEIKDLKQLEKHVPNFQEEFQKEKIVLYELYQKKNKEFMKKYSQTLPSILRIVNTRGHDLNILMDVYNKDISDDNLGKAICKIRNYIRKKSHSALFNYHSYLQVRSKFEALNKYIDGIITLSVSPKKNRLGIYPIDRHIEKLPYHGIPVWHREKENFTIEYLIDVRRSHARYIKVFLKNDFDVQPFYYVKD